MRTSRLLRCVANESRLRVGMPVSAFAFTATDTPETLASRAGIDFVDAEDLRRLTASPAFNPTHPTSTGRITNQISDNVFVVTFDPTPTALYQGKDVEVGTRVTWSKPVAAPATPTPTPTQPQSTASQPQAAAATATTAAVNTPPPPATVEVKATVTKLHGNGLIALLEDDTGDFNNAVPRDQVKLLRSSANLDTNDALLSMMDWLRKSGGVRKPIDAYSAACVLYRKGWRLQDIHLVEAADVHVLKFLPRSARMTIIEAAERERDVARIQREMKKETLMEQDWSYWLSKYSKVWGPMAGGFSVLTAFLWNYKNYQRGMRPAQIDIAANSWNHVPPTASHVTRQHQEDKLSAAIEDLDVGHPRLLVVTGNIGVGKTLLISAVATRLAVPTLSVELRGAAKDDVLLTLVKALGVPNVNVCGELGEFIKDVTNTLRQRTGKVPVLVLKVRDDDVDKIFRDALVLSRHARVILEVESERAKHSLLRARQVTFFHVTDFSREEAKEFVGHRVDPVALEEYMDEIGTNATDLDAIITATVDKQMDPFDATAKRLQRAIADVRTQSREARRGLLELCRARYETGVPTVPEVVAFSPMVQYDPAAKVYVFRTRALYEAARIVTHADDLERTSASTALAAA